MGTRGIPDAGLVLGLNLHVSAIYFQDCLRHSFNRYNTRLYVHGPMILK